MARKKYKYTILFEDKHIMAVSKPPGLLSVPIPGMRSLNLQDMVRRDHGDSLRPAHRIDRYTSGIVLFAKSSKAHYKLMKQFRMRTAKRSYLALVRGVVEPKSGTLVHHMKRIKKGFRNVVVDKDDDEGTRAELNYSVMEQYPNSCLLRVDLVSGLKNQIRVQLSEAGYPLIGDRHYNAQEENEPWIDRQALHAAELGIVHPVDGRELTFRSPVPQDMEKLISIYKKGQGAKDLGG
ncbi:MAG: RluA family pseudouridine synthase [Balneolia bacterium]|nr:RluA family pseudouridine synthase [Balneolia bacterium]